MVIASVVMFVTPQPAGCGMTERVGAWAMNASTGWAVVGADPPWR
jgi:hypothetical protein